MLPEALRARPALAALLAACALAAPLRGAQPLRPPEDPGEGSGRPPERGAAEVRCTDGSVLRLTLRDERLELSTPYGRLLVPVADVRRIDFATRLPEDVARQVEAAVAGLGKEEFRQREAATAALLGLREKAYPALLEAERSPDKEVARRAAELLARVRDAVPAEQLECRPFDVVYTDDSKITGRLTAVALKVTTAQFGDQPLRLADVRTLSTPGGEADVKDALPDPGNLVSLQSQVGKSFTFRVKGATPNLPGAGEALWGTDVYTLDSSLALASVHAGVLRPGQAGVVRVTVLGPQPAFQGSSRNGVTSMPYGAFPSAFRVHR